MQWLLGLFILAFGMMGAAYGYAGPHSGWFVVGGIVLIITGGILLVTDDEYVR